MGRKFLFNILLNLALIVVVYSLVKAYRADQYLVVAGALGVVLLLSYFKIKLLKHVRVITKDQDKK